MVSQSSSLDQRLSDFLRFTGRQASGDNAIFILVLGMTGSGKSTFIRHCTGRNVQIGHSLQSCTNDLAVHSFWLAGQHVHLIDTPGFDDTNHSDIDILKTIASYLSASFANGVRLSGIVYLHRISDNRLGGSGMRNLRMFKKLSGSSTWPNTVIGTTMWSANEYFENKARETELANDPNYFGDILSGGASLVRIAEHGTGLEEQKVSSLSMIANLIQRIEISPKISLQIQSELVNDDKMLDATAAGQEAMGDLYHMKLQLTAQLESTRHDMEDATRMRDVESARQLQAVEMEFARKLSLAETRQVELKTSLIDMHDKEVHKLLKRLDHIEERQRQSLRGKRKELEDMEESLRLMREQSAIDEARWKQQKMDVVVLKKKHRVRRDADREAEQSLVALKQDVLRERDDVVAVGKARRAVRDNVITGVSNGFAAAGATAVATVALGLMCVVS